MEHILISNARHLRLPNSFGIKKIMRNMLALRQSIKTLTNDHQNTEFERAKRYYAYFFMTPQVRFQDSKGAVLKVVWQFRICWMIYASDSLLVLMSTRSS